jgi:glycosyltransferase involved in cell wall biosynthesis
MKNLVSVIIPCYNAENYVSEAIENALHQSYDPIEVIVVDDGSTDGSLDVIKSFSEQVTWRTGENQGVSAARNRGIEIAEGEFVKFLDADDMLPEHAVETQVSQIREINRERASVFGDSLQIGPEGIVIGHSSFRQMRDEEDPISYILKVNPGVSYPLHRRKYLEEIGGFDEGLPWAEDYDLHLRLHLAGILMQYRTANVVRVRQHEDDNRLTNRKTKEFEETPWAPYKRARDREQKIREACEGSLSDAVSQHLAKGFWSSGRQAIKSGHTHIAKKYFDHARELHSQPIASPSRLYHMAVRMLGPTNTEHLVQWVRRVQQRLP